jgi:hypothetical protein
MPSLGQTRLLLARAPEGSRLLLDGSKLAVRLPFRRVTSRRSISFCKSWRSVSSSTPILAASNSSRVGGQGHERLCGA